MLEPGDRQLFTEALRPPEGYRFDRAVSTTYTLDLLTLLTLPVSFGLQQWVSADGERRIDPLSLLEAVRRHARRIHLFHDAGRIAVPKRTQLLFSRLEESVIAVQAPNGGVFHPKVTVVRYVAEPAEGSEDGQAGESVCYRLLCASRNCTFDRSWDTMLVLEGELALGRTRAIARNKPLAAFIEALPQLATQAVPEQTREDVALLADEVQRVRFELPPGFDDMAFWPIGLDASEAWPFQSEPRRMLVVSPFVDGACLDWLGAQAGELHLVSRVEGLDELADASVEACKSTYVLNEAADGLEPEGEADDSADEAEGPPIGPARDDTGAAAHDDNAGAIESSAPPLRGLHAKLFVADAGGHATIWTGSANATGAAFERNVEFLVELKGVRHKHGVRKLLKGTGDDGEADRDVGFGDLLVPYRREEQCKPDEVNRRLERLIDDTRAALVAASLSARIEAEPLSDGGERLFTTILEAADTSAIAKVPAAVGLSVRPITLRTESAAAFDRSSGAEIARFTSMSMEAITGFVAFDVEARHGDRTMHSGFVLNVPLINPPADREQRLLLAMLSNRERLLRYLLMLLDDPELDPRRLFEDGKHRGGGLGVDHHDDFGLPLLEPLMRALDGEPTRLERIARLVDDLRMTEEGRDLVPASFLEVWEPIWAARKEADRAGA